MTPNLHHRGRNKSTFKTDQLIKEGCGYVKCGYVKEFEYPVIYGTSIFDPELGAGSSVKAYGFYVSGQNYTLLHSAVKFSHNARVAVPGSCFFICAAIMCFGTAVVTPTAMA